MNIFLALYLMGLIIVLVFLASNRIKINYKALLITAVWPAALVWMIGVFVYMNFLRRKRSERHTSI